MMQTLWVFPGQGSQQAGLLATVNPAILARVTALTGVTLSDTTVGYQDPVQIQLSILSRQLDQLAQCQQLGWQPQAVAGHSLGVFAAAVAAGSLTVDTAIQLVATRAQAMRSAYPTGYGMGVVVGLTRTELAPLVASVHTEATPVYLSNQNTPLQTTLSGALPAIQQVLTLALAQGAQHAKLLHVPSPSHSPLMAAVAQQLTARLADCDVQRPRCSYLANWNGRRTLTADGVRYDLENNLRYPVYWATMMAVAEELGTQVAMEFAPGTVFTKLSQAQQPNVRTIALAQQSIDDADFLLTKWKEVL
ncbi:acyltransferase domain-containing protein [Lactiplantibacillus mudanjiangensis]|uniref:[acyl-carrier-protein] S-malonyltransferase n=1 Tax=Lactiplantibacillus mudanjiangensis TaxID=1296538 RepID=A0A660E1D3_9LACO|nr:acyltransferase domain-containing protein [Lactiplantibacillus mudanjiangensis]VDG26274.1 acyl transferase [Lactobacillus sp.] [Lactiplantibacillus mudanjiangensis]VDG29452.1 acyl transferase [Lactobacillus sp.] [Lactiplantibacillus mudanjiangensis]